MLRYLGVPARVAAGFTSGKYDADKRTWTVTDHDAHAWVEVWFRGWGWLPFDPTPARGELAGSYTTASPHFNASAALLGAAGSTRCGCDSVLGREGDQRVQLGRPRRGGGSGGTGDAVVSHGASLLRLLALVLAGALLLVVAIKLLVRRGRYLTRDPRRLAGACRRELADYLADQRVAIPSSATPHELAAIVGKDFSVDARPFAEALAGGRSARPQGRARQRGRHGASCGGWCARCGSDSRARSACSGSCPCARSASPTLIREAVVMAAGEGRRLRPLSERYAKPVLPIDGRPVVVDAAARPRGGRRRARLSRDRAPCRADRAAASRRRRGVRRRRAVRAPAARGRLRGRRPPRARGRGGAAAPRRRRRHASSPPATSTRFAGRRRAARRRDRGTQRPAAGAGRPPRRLERRARHPRHRRRPAGPARPAPRCGRLGGAAERLDGLAGTALRTRARVPARHRRGLDGCRGRDRKDARPDDPFDVIAENFPYLRGSMSETYDLFRQGSDQPREGMAAQATVPLEKAKKREPDKASIREALGIAYFRIRRCDEAEAEFRAMLELSPTDDYAHYALGRVPREAGARPRGERALQARELAAAGGAHYASRIRDLSRRERAIVEPASRRRACGLTAQRRLGEIGPGLAVLLGVAEGDDTAPRPSGWPGRSRACGSSRTTRGSSTGACWTPAAPRSSSASSR